MMVFRTTLAAAVALLLVGLAGPASGAVILESLSAGPFGGAQVDGFAADNKQAYRYTLGTFTDTVSGISGDENDSAFYTATMTYSVPAAGSLLSASGDLPSGPTSRRELQTLLVPDCCSTRTCPSTLARHLRSQGRWRTRESCSGIQMAWTCFRSQATTFLVQRTRSRFLEC